ncbi:hypothetical protein TSUD_69160 [Trifolium subterraneum]|uniref:Cathepsin propeptide inhibitor domain-containing protein n=1 Tax=Trifolium subterraneum TaxID=3900 RepID=A0A2Z6N4M4_TRISU|nr:hypothetical protein TSUD_69160 [Trifolium subterraneum]
MCLSFALPNDQLNKFSSSDEDVFQLFKQWQIEHGREYGTTKEKEKRLEIFKSNLMYINEMNAKRKSPLQHRLSLNKFADMSPDEFSKTYLQEIEMQIPSKFHDQKHTDNDKDIENLPASVDWRKKGAVTDVVSIDNLYVLDGTEEAFVDRVSKQPVSVSLDGTGLQFYSGGVYGGEYCTKDSKTTNLVVLIVGYDSVDGEDYWIVKNSWGKDWGEKGYLYIKRNVIKEWPYGVCAIYFAGGYPIKTVSSSSI